MLGDHLSEVKHPKSFTVGAGGLGSSTDHTPGKRFQDIANLFTNKTEPKPTRDFLDSFRCTFGKPNLSQELQLEQPGPLERISTSALGCGADPQRINPPKSCCAPPPARPAVGNNLTSRVCYSGGKNTPHLPGINACLGTKLFSALLSTSPINSCPLDKCSS